MEPTIKPPIAQLLPAEFAEMIARRFVVLGEPTRLRLLDCLIERGEASVQELSGVLDVPYPNVSKHLNVLHAERVVGRRKQATSVIYFIADDTVIQICQLVCDRLREQLREFGALVGSDRGSALRATTSQDR